MPDHRAAQDTTGNPNTGARPWDRQQAPASGGVPGDAVHTGQRARWSSGTPGPRPGPPTGPTGQRMGPPPGHRPAGGPASGPPTTTRYRIPGQQRTGQPPVGQPPVGQPPVGQSHAGQPPAGQGPPPSRSVQGRPLAPQTGASTQVVPHNPGTRPPAEHTTRTVVGPRHPAPQQAADDTATTVGDDMATEMAPTIGRAAPGVSPGPRERTHYGGNDAGAGQDDPGLPTGRGDLSRPAGDGDRRFGDDPLRDAGEAEETSVAGDRGRAANTNLLSVVALVLSVLGVTAPIGLFLAYTSLRTIRRTGELGAPFAVAAKWLAWLWIVFFVFGAIAYFWIGSQSG